MNRDRRRRWPLWLLVLGGSFSVAIFGLVAFRVATETVSSLLSQQDESARTIAVDLVSGVLTQLKQAVAGTSADSVFVAAVERHDVEGVRSRLDRLIASEPSVERVFVTDPRAVMWSDAPREPESDGQSFADRDWYRGLRRGIAPFVSGVHRRHAESRHLVVAAATPVRDPSGGEVAILVAQIDLQSLSDLIRRIAPGADRSAVLLDHDGKIVAHSRLDPDDAAAIDEDGRISAYVKDDLARRARSGETCSAETVDPFTHEAVDAGFRPFSVNDAYWVIGTARTVASERSTERWLAIEIGVAGAVLALLVVSAMLLLGRAFERARQKSDRLEREYRKLEAIDRAREARLRESEEQLVHAQRLEAVARLAGGVAHDFNNLLTVIIGFCEMLRSDLRDGTESREAVEEIARAASRASALTRQLLAFGRRQTFQPRILDLNRIVTGLDPILRQLLGADVDLALVLAPDLGHVRADPVHVEQVIMNLVVNARDAMPTGGRITLVTSNVEWDEAVASLHPGGRAGRFVRLAITDTGHGMDEATLRRIFEPFFTTKDRGKGTGLGLSTVHGIVKQSEGFVSVSSAPGVGSTFEVFLPRFDAEPEPIDATPAPVRVTGGTETILFVEDDADVRRLVARVLRGAGYDLIECGDPQDALALARDPARKIHLLLTDVVMPHMSGPELAQEIVTTRPNVRVLFMSGYAHDALTQHGVVDIGRSFLEKPVAPQKLLERLRELLDPRPG